MEGDTESIGRTGLPMMSHTRSQSQGTPATQGFDNDDNRHTTHDRRIPLQPLHPLEPQPPAGYASHIRSSSRTSWDGRLQGHPARSPSPSPPGSPVRRTRLERPYSMCSLPDHHAPVRPVLTSRWSYDRERMPSPPLMPHGSRPNSRPNSRPPSPLSEASVFPFSRPASIFIESRPGSRPPSIIINTPADQGYSCTASTPTLRVHPPAADGKSDATPWQDGSGSEPGSARHSRQFRDSHPYHELTSAELDMLSRPPPTPTAPVTPILSPPMPAPNMKFMKSAADLGPHEPKTKGQDSDNETREPRGCCGLCDISTARCIGGTFGGWFMGTLIPVTFALVTGCITAAFN